MPACVALVGEVSYSRIGSGLTTTIHDDGTTSTVVTNELMCACCELDRPRLGGLHVKDELGEVVMWLCSQCRG